MIEAHGFVTAALALAVCVGATEERPTPKEIDLPLVRGERSIRATLFVDEPERVDESGLCLGVQLRNDAQSTVTVLDPSQAMMVTIVVGESWLSGGPLMPSHIRGVTPVLAERQIPPGGSVITDRCFTELQSKDRRFPIRSAVPPGTHRLNVTLLVRARGKEARWLLFDRDSVPILVVH